MPSNRYIALPWAFLLLMSLTVTGQRVVAELVEPKYHIFKDFQCFRLGDTLLIKHEVIGDDTRDRAYFLFPNGDLKKFSTPLPDNRLYCALEKRPNSGPVLYYIEARRKNAYVRGVSIDPSSGATSELEFAVEIPGKILGVESRNNNLHIYSFEKKAYTVNETVINAGTILSKNEVKLSVDLSIFKPQHVTLIKDANTVVPAQAAARAKLFVNDSIMHLIVDEATEKWLAPEPGEQVPLNKTTSIRIRRSSGKSEIRTFRAPEFSSFSSYAFGNMLFRRIEVKGEGEIQVFDVVSGKTVASIPTAAPSYPVLLGVREGRKARTTVGSTILKNFTFPGDIFIAANPDQDGKLTITTGGYLDDNTTPVFLLMPFPVAGLILIAFSVVVAETMDGPGISNYCYLSGDIESGFSLRTTLGNSLRERLDFYEYLQQKNSVRMKPSGYFEDTDSLIAFYQMEKENKIRIVAFDK